MRFRDKYVLVTGSSQNTGLGIVAAFLREGATVFLNGTRPENIAAGSASLKAQGLDQFITVPCDIGDETAVEAMFTEIRRHTPRLDVLVNNAVNLGCGPSFLETPMQLYKDVFRINLLGTIHVSQQAAKMMLPDGGAIVHIGSNVSTRAIRNRSAYCTSKGGIDALTLAMALELAPLGIRVNNIAPGYIYTNRWDQLNEEIATRRRKNIPLGQEASAGDVAETVLFLASDAARNICGVRLLVDGGCSSQHLPIDVDL